MSTTAQHSHPLRSKEIHSTHSRTIPVKPGSMLSPRPPLLMLSSSKLSFYCRFPHQHSVHVTIPALPALLHLFALMMFGPVDIRQMFLAVPVAPCGCASTLVYTNISCVLSWRQNHKQGICSWKVPDTFGKKTVRRELLRKSLILLCSKVAFCF